MASLRLMAIDEICQRGSVRDADVGMLRRAFAREPQLSPSDVEALFRIHTMARIQDPNWADFFIETLTDYVVREMEPSGYVTASQAGWLIARISSGGRVRTKIEFDLLLNVIDKARWVPESLMAYALTQVRDAVVLGTGALRSPSAVDARMITSQETEQVRRLLYAYGADRPAAITQCEIDLLLDIDAALVEAALGQHTAEIDAWSQLFCKALADAVLSASGYAGPSREECLREKPVTWRAGRTGEGRPSVIAEARGILVFYRQLSAQANSLAVLERQRVEIITGEPVRQADAGKLAVRVMDPTASLRVCSILRALQDTGAQLHPVFAGPQPAVEHAA